VRIISGKFKGKRINAPKNKNVRPTTDMAKEGLFNILTNSFDFESLKVLDLFSGTGNISFEFASRGCEKIISVEKEYRSFKFIIQTANHLDMPIKVIRADAFKFLQKTNDKFDIIFADPPYWLKNIELLPDLVFERKLLNEHGLFILEHSGEKKEAIKGHDFETRTYGKVNFSIFKAGSTANFDQ